MKVICEIKSRMIDEDSNMIVSFQLLDYNSKKIIEELDKNKKYQFVIKEFKSQRSLNQNKLLWAIIGGSADYLRSQGETDIDDMKLYCDLLEMNNCKFFYIKLAKKDDINNMKEIKGVRAIRYIGSEINHHNVREYTFKCYIGSSQYNIKEMNFLIDKAMQMASELGLDFSDERLRL